MDIIGFFQGLFTAVTITIVSVFSVPTPILPLEPNIVQEATPSATPTITVIPLEVEEVQAIPTDKVIPTKTMSIDHEKTLEIKTESIQKQGSTDPEQAKEKIQEAKKDSKAVSE